MSPRRAEPEPASADGVPPRVAPAIRRVLETCLYVDDVRTAREWYARVLGLREHTFDPPKQVFFALDGAMLLLFDVAEKRRASREEVPTHGATGPGHVAFAVTPDELAAWERRLTAEGVAIEQRHEWPGGGRSLYFRDPAGNSLELATREIWFRGEAPSPDEASPHETLRG